MFVWDDTEYVTQALDTFEHVNDHGLISWPGYIARRQIVKPPLYVNTLTASLFVFGRERGAVAAGASAASPLVLFGLVVYWLVSRLAKRGGVAATAGCSRFRRLPLVSRRVHRRAVDRARAARRRTARGQCGALEPRAHCPPRSHGRSRAAGQDDVPDVSRASRGYWLVAGRRGPAATAAPRERRHSVRGGRRPRRLHLVHHPGRGRALLRQGVVGIPARSGGGGCVRQKSGVVGAVRRARMGLLPRR